MVIAGALAAPAIAEAAAGRPARRCVSRPGLGAGLDGRDAAGEQQCEEADERQHRGGSAGPRSAPRHSRRRRPGTCRGDVRAVERLLQLRSLAWRLVAPYLRRTPGGRILILSGANTEPVLRLAQSGRVDPIKVVSDVLDWETLHDALPEMHTKPVFVRDPVSATQLATSAAASA
jgi:hypothetical protein